jgi:IS5 family transposase
LFAKVGEVLQEQGMKVGTGTIVDATIISAPSSTKNAQKERDPEMHQTRKGQQWYFGMKLHIGVDSKTGLAHSAVVTAANVHDKHPLPATAARPGAEVLRRQRLRLAAGTGACQGTHGART